MDGSCSGLGAFIIDRKQYCHNVLSSLKASLLSPYERKQKRGNHKMQRRRIHNQQPHHNAPPRPPPPAGPSPRAPSPRVANRQKPGPQTAGAARNMSARKLGPSAGRAAVWSGVGGAGRGRGSAAGRQSGRGRGAGGVLSRGTGRMNALHPRRQRSPPPRCPPQPPPQPRQTTSRIVSRPPHPRGAPPPPPTPTIPPRARVASRLPQLPLPTLCRACRKVDIRLPGKGNSNSHGVRPVY